MKGQFIHRRIMAYLAIFGMLYCAYGVVHNNVVDGAIGGLVAAFAAVVGTFMTNATYDDHSNRKHKNGKD